MHVTSAALLRNVCVCTYTRLARAEIRRAVDFWTRSFVSFRDSFSFLSPRTPRRYIIESQQLLVYSLDENYTTDLHKHRRLFKRTVAADLQL